MFLLWFLEILAILVVGAILLTQFAIPLLMNKPILWLFRKKTPQANIEKLKSKLAEADAEAEVAALKEKLKDRKAGGSEKEESKKDTAKFPWQY